MMRTNWRDRRRSRALSRTEDPTSPRFFFHIHHANPDLDEVGTELADVEAARAAAGSLARRLLLDDAERFWSTTNWSLEVKDEMGSTVFALRFHQGAAVQ